MFPGYTLLDLRARHEDMLREASRERARRSSQRLTDGRDTFLHRYVMACVAGLLAILGL